MNEYWYSIFNEATTNNQPLHYKVIQEYFGNDVVKIFVKWIAIRWIEISAG